MMGTAAAMVVVRARARDLAQTRATLTRADTGLARLDARVVGRVVPKEEAARDIATRAYCVYVPRVLTADWRPTLRGHISICIEKAEKREQQK
jgi:hypothetical protein